jgi:prophage DNA circulation protein
MPACFRSAFFHVEAGSMESGRRVVNHEYPKKDLSAPNYAEDMGRRAKMFTVRGYTIVYGRQTGIALYDPDYRIARDALIDALETAGPGVLQLPTMRPFKVMCQSYRWTEEERTGGYCTFDMTFVEYGSPPSNPEPDSIEQMQRASLAMKQLIAGVLAGPPSS